MNYSTLLMTIEKNNHDLIDIGKYLPLEDENYFTNILEDLDKYQQENKEDLLEIQASYKYIENRHEDKNKSLLLSYLKLIIKL